MTVLATLIIFKSSFICFFHFRSFWLIFFSRVPLDYSYSYSLEHDYFSVYFQPFLYVFVPTSTHLKQVVVWEVSSYIPNTVCEMSESHVEVLKTLLRVREKHVSWMLAGAVRNHSLQSSCPLRTILIWWSGSNVLKVYIPVLPSVTCVYTYIHNTDM